MNQVQICLYCLRSSKISNSLSVLDCSCALCLKCVDFLKQNNIFSCPFCKTKLKDTQVEAQESGSFMKLQNLNSLKNTLIEKQKALTSKSLSELSKLLKDLLKTYKLKQNNMKTFTSLRKTEKICRDSSFILETSKIFKMLEFTNSMNLFQYNQKYTKILYLNYENCCANELRDMSRIALKREHSKIFEFERCIFFGKFFTFYRIGSGTISHRFKILSGDPILVTEIGIGHSVGNDSSVYLMKVEILEDDEMISYEVTERLIHNQDSRLTFPLILKTPFWMFSGKTYRFSYTISASFLYSVRYVDEITEIEGLKIKHFDMENVAFLTFYVRGK